MGCTSSTPVAYIHVPKSSAVYPNANVKSQRSQTEQQQPSTGKHAAGTAPADEVHDSNNLTNDRVENKTESHRDVQSILNNSSNELLGPNLRMSQKSIVPLMSAKQSSIVSVMNRRRSRHSVSSIEFDLSGEVKELLGQGSDGNFYLTIVQALYDDLDCSDEVQDLISSDDELMLQGGAHMHVLRRKPHYYKTFEMTYCYQTDVMQISRRISDLDDNSGIVIDAPPAHELNIMKAFIGDVDVTGKLRLLVIDSRRLNLYVNTKSFKDLLSSASEVKNEGHLSHENSFSNESIVEISSHGNDEDSAISPATHITLLYAFQTPCWSINCKGNEDIRIPSYQSMLTSQPPENTTIAPLSVSLVSPTGAPNPNHQNYPIKPIRRVMSHAHLVSKRKDIPGIDDQSPLTSTSKSLHQSVVKVVPTTMRGYINKESPAKRMWTNRYFILDSTEKLAHLAYYRSESSRWPYGKDLKGEVLLVDYSLSLHGDIIVLRSNVRHEEGLALEIKDHEQRKRWIKAFKEHMEYADSEKRRTEALEKDSQSTAITTSDEGNDTNEETKELEHDLIYQHETTFDHSNV